MRPCAYVPKAACDSPRATASSATQRMPPAVFGRRFASRSGAKRLINWSIRAFVGLFCAVHTPATSTCDAALQYYTHTTLFLLKQQAPPFLLPAAPTLASNGRHALCACLRPPCHMQRQLQTPSAQHPQASTSFKCCAAQAAAAPHLPPLSCCAAASHLCCSSSAALGRSSGSSTQAPAWRTETPPAPAPAAAAAAAHAGMAPRSTH